MIKSFFEGLGLTAIAALLFAGSFPNPLIENGVPFLAWVAYVPVFFLLYRVSLGVSALWGALYGYTAYLLFNYWL
ncbi:MAG: apolipoprotein N-acyltransferase, partial [Treponema sp.]|nr:apolipoprotein N-acyltransferase [Treponema sp.]